MALFRSVLGVTAGVAMLAAGCAENSTRSAQSTVYGKNGEKLTIQKPKYQDIERGGTETVTIHLERKNFNDAVNVSMTDLPSGVEAVDAPRDTTGDEVKIVLRANDNADLVTNHSVLVSAEGPDGFRASETFPLTVKERH